MFANIRESRLLICCCDIKFEWAREANFATRKGRGCFAGLHGLRLALVN
jgi:hypothetical protein